MIPGAVGCCLPWAVGRVDGLTADRLSPHGSHASEVLVSSGRQTSFSGVLNPGFGPTLSTVIGRGICPSIGSRGWGSRTGSRRPSRRAGFHGRGHRPRS